MDAATCLKKLEYVGVLAFATVGRDGSPQVRNISAIHYEPDASISSPPGERTSARNCWPTAGCKSWATRSIRR